MAKSIIAIDPGSTQSAYIIWNGTNIPGKGKIGNEVLLRFLRDPMIFPTQAVIEGINPYTMGKTTRDTILWSGRFQEAFDNNSRTGSVEYLFRNDVRQNMCNSKSTKINDTVITQALVDRFAYGQKNKGKGTKKEPGFFYGFSRDIWQAFALAVTWYDLNKNLK